MFMKIFRLEPQSEKTGFKSSKESARSFKKNQGFTLIEVLVVIVIMGVVMSAAAYLIVTALWVTQANKERLEANYLAQECVELMRNRRDTAWKRFQSWDCGTGTTKLTATPGNNEYIIGAKEDPPPGSGSACSGNFNIDLDPLTASNSKIYRHPGRLNHDGSGTDTAYSRKVFVNTLTSEAINFDCVIEWNSRGQNRALTLSSELTNWYQP